MVDQLILKKKYFIGNFTSPLVFNEKKNTGACEQSAKLELKALKKITLLEYYE